VQALGDVALAVAGLQASPPPIDPNAVISNAQTLVFQIVGGVMAIGVVVFVVHAFFHPERSITRIIGVAALAVVAFLFIAFPTFPLAIAEGIGNALHL
jgi:hypothetical protein